MAGFQDFLRNNNQALLQAGLGMLSGQNAQQQVALGAQGLNNAMNVNKTMQFLQGSYPELAQAVQMGAMSPSDAWKMAYQQKLEAQKPRNDYMAVGKNLFNRSTGEWISPPAGVGGADDAEYGLNPQYGVDANGNPVIVQLSKSGTSKQTALPEGVSLSKEPIKLDAGTHFVLLDPITRQPIGQIPKDLAGAERQKEVGTAEGKAVASAPGDIQAGMNAKDLIDQIRTNPALERGTGMSSIGNMIPGTSGYDFQNLVDQAKSGAFLQAVQQMRGLGALSNNEGSAATQAITRMNTATSKEAFLKALDDYQAIIDQGIARAQSKLGGAPQAQSTGSVVDYTDYFKP
ncbi:MAG: hypothetical protein QMD99_13830 [Rhizobiaceae bacterium]|nr:hypothetical protein [Rhizobiaceae bacterium]